MASQIEQAILLVSHGFSYIMSQGMAFICSNSGKTGLTTSSGNFEFMEQSFQHRKEGKTCTKVYIEKIILF